MGTWEDTLDNSNPGESRGWLDRPGTVYLQLVEYAFIDGTGHTGKMGPAFGFRVVGSLDGAYALGSSVGRMVAVNRQGKTPVATATIRDLAVREIVEIFAALLSSKSGKTEECDVEKVKKLAPMVDTVASHLVGTVVRADAKPGKNPAFVNLSWAADDRS